MKRKELISKLIERDGNTCCNCGRLLNDDTATIDHVFPARFGGTNFLGNLRLLCKHCNCTLAGFELSEKKFQDYLLNFLNQDSRFHNIQSNVSLNTPSGQKIMPDIMFSRTINGKTEQYIIEVKHMLSATDSSVNLACKQITYYKALCPDFHFILAVPTALAQEHQQQINALGISLWDREVLRLGVPDVALPVGSAPDLYDELITRLRQCEPGKETWLVYQKLVGDILYALFSPPLELPSEQNSDADYKNRRDYVIPNYAEHGYWAYLRERYHAEFIVVDAKNSANFVNKSDILQVAHYLKEKGLGLFGIIFSRIGTDESAELHLMDIWRDENKMIVVLNDNDVEQMLLNRQNEIDPCRIIIEKIQEFRQKI